ncbi:hypothetical protein DQP55_11220 [Mycolicibacterium sp. GF69]|nr:hypothetical protein DQP55_11220 [Mycolicibacterium sp. GF69]
MEAAGGVAVEGGAGVLGRTTGADGVGMFVVEVGICSGRFIPHAARVIAMKPRAIARCRMGTG